MSSFNPKDMMGSIVSARPFLKEKIGLSKEPEEGRIVAWLADECSFKLESGTVAHRYACKLLETSDGECHRHHIDFHNGHDDALMKLDAEGAWDTAWPIDWLMDVQRVLGDDYRPFGGHVVWHYPKGNICGKPVGICKWAQAMIDEYRRRKAAR